MICFIVENLLSRLKLFLVASGIHCKQFLKNSNCRMTQILPLPRISKDIRSISCNQTAPLSRYRVTQLDLLPSIQRSQIQSGAEIYPFNNTTMAIMLFLFKNTFRRLCDSPSHQRQLKPGEGRTGERKIEK